ncbi:MAG: glycosyltransferase [Desulfovibrio sp.]
MLPPNIPILCYHDVSPARGSLSLERFCEHLDALRDDGWRSITARELYDVVTGKRPVPRKALVLTFDDGHWSNFLRVAPELEKRGLSGVFFAVTDFIVPGTARTLADAPADKPMPDCFRDALTLQDYSQFINEGEIQALLSAGHEVHAHGARHQGCFRTLAPRGPLGTPKAHWASVGIYPDPRPGLPSFEVGSAYVYDGFWPASADQEPRFVRRSEAERLEFCRRDFSRSLERIRDLNRCDVQLFCWPWGNSDAKAESELKQAGFQGAFTLERGPNVRGTDPFRLKRIGVASGKSGKWLQSRLRMYSSAPGALLFFKKLRKRPDISHVLLATDSTKISGGSRQLINNAVALHNLGMRVTVCVPKASPIAAELPEGVALEHFDRFRQPLCAASFLFRFCRERAVDVVHTFHNKAYKPAILARMAGFLAGRSFRLFINRGVIFKANALFGLWSRLASGMIVNSFACADSLRKLGVPGKRLNVVYNAFAPGPSAPPDREARKKRGLRVLCLGNEAPAKGLDVFLAAVADYVQRFDARDVEFVVAGARKLGPMLQDLPAEVLARVRDAGVVPHAEALDLLRHSDLLVIPSRQESMPNVLLEAFHSGLPVVCTRAGGIPELVRDGENGLLCALEDAVCLSEKIRYLVESREERLRMGRLNQEFLASRFTNRNKGLNLLRVYHGLHLAALPELPVPAPVSDPVPTSGTHEEDSQAE